VVQQTAKEEHAPLWFLSDYLHEYGFFVNKVYGKEDKCI
jgi:hypothetical protein